MKFAVLGTGMVGEALAGKLAALGHEVKLGSRDESAAKAAAWAAQAGPRASNGSYGEAAGFGEIVINGLQGAATLPVLGDLKSELAGKLLIDIANPLDFSKGFPPTLFIGNDRSLAEEVQKLLPQTKVVKALNTVHAPVMVNPSLVPGEHDIFVSGDDAAAKARVVELLQSFGWKSPIDLGDLDTARGTEQLLPLWLRLYGAFGTGMFNLRVVRA
jgi:8-hydroxy-5-deazaflavin:NADPH oxidoreductase